MHSEIHITGQPILKKELKVIGETSLGGDAGHDDVGAASDERADAAGNRAEG